MEIENTTSLWKRVGFNICFDHFKRCIHVNSARPICSVLVLKIFVSLPVCWWQFQPFWTQHLTYMTCC